jgi:4-amino-4-deoxy-L-arabinose transferase-like glycosyltransferase
LDEAIPNKKRRVRFWLLLAGLVVLALSLRLGYIWGSHDLLQFRTPTPGLDIDLHWQAAQEMRQSAQDGPRFALMTPSAPLFPGLLSLLQTFLGESLWPYRIVMALLGSLTVLLIFLAVRRISRERSPAWISGLIAACYPVTVYFDTRLIKAAPELCLLAALIMLLTHFRKRSTWENLAYSCGLGLLLALLITSQLNTFLYFLAVVLFVWLQFECSVKQRLMTVGVVTAWVGLAGLLMNNLDDVFEDQHPVFIPVSGIHTLIGFHPGATGSYHNLEGIPGFPYGHAFIARMKAEVELGKSLTPQQADRYYLGKTIDFIGEHPAEAIGLIFKKMFLFLNNFETKGNEYFYDLKARSTLLSLLPLSFGVLLILAYFGCVYMFRIQQRRLLLLLGLLAGCVLASNLITFVTWRYRLHVIVPLILLAGPGLLEIGHLLKTGFKQKVLRVPKALVVMLPAVLIGLFSFWPVDAAAVAKMESKVRDNLRFSENAETRLQIIESLQQDSSFRAQLKKVNMLFLVQRHSLAFKMVRDLVERHIESPPANYFYVRYLAWMGDSNKALSFMTLLRDTRPQAYTATLRMMPPLMRDWLRVIGGAV